MFAKLFLRDALIAAAVAGGWVLFWPLSSGGGAVADVSGVLLGLGAGVVAHLGHEWGHLVGAVLSGSRVAAPARLSSPFLFSFDSRRNSKRQFVVMSLSGFAVTAVSLYVAYGVLPPEALATRVARGLVVFSAALTVVLEVPLLIASLLSGSILRQVEVFRPETTAAASAERPAGAPRI
jgi:hypothetical protein